MILTPDQRLRVFVSSTLGELAPERVSVRGAVERLHLIPVMFELGARPHPPAQLYRAYLDQSHVFVGVYWERYGWVAPDETISGLEDEFLRSDGMPRLMYIKEPAPERDAALTELIGRLADNPDSSYRRFSTLEELADLVEGDLAILLSERFEANDHPVVVPGSTMRNAPPALLAPLTPTIGRRYVVEAIADLVRSGARLVTITGTGGVGKTRVASEVARAVEPDFDEVRIVRIGDVVDPALVTATIAAAIGATVERARPALDAVVDAVGADHLLLVLDNLEQVTEAGPELALLLDRCPGLALLITSRHVLRLRGEHEHPLAPLEVPGRTAEDAPDAVERLGAMAAVELFVEHATAARPAFRLDASNAAAVAELCRRLDGLPLAIELVAARTRLLSPEALLDRLGDRIDLLASGSVDLPDRQRTLRATLDWSHRLLDEREQALFARLAVFRGGASLEAVEAVCAAEPIDDVLETLSSLLEKSLVVLVEDTGAGPRIAMLQTVRAYAWERLLQRPELAATRDRHAERCLQLVLSCDPAHQARATNQWAELERDLPNVRAAIAWRTEQDDGAALGLFAASLWAWYWLGGRMSEGRAWIEGLAPRLDRAEGVADGEAEACVSEALGAVRFSLGDRAGAEALLRRALAAYRATDDLEGIAIVSCLLAVIIPAVDGSIAEAVELATAAVAGGRALGLDWGLAFALAVLGSVTRREGSVEQGIALQHEALVLAREVGELVLIGQILGQLAIGALRDGDLDEAASFLAEAADCCRLTRQTEETVFCLEIGAAIAFGDDRIREAAVLMGAADAIRDRVEVAVWPVMQAQRAALVAALAEALGPDEHAAARAAGCAADPFVLLPTTTR
ncbi:DUF4062 domain-containing protein [Aquihabitans sp. McL0605]|uniref:DUF4062 domain-containing protein n=1 Tax=Aquihabitans sp. McL0605 TaxID=3415671 RepID=UPI003CE9C2D0